jgi:hypothetical protein
VSTHALNAEAVSEYRIDGLCCVPSLDLRQFH